MSCAHSLTNNGQLSSAMNGVGFGPFLLLDYHYWETLPFEKIALHYETRFKFIHKCYRYRLKAYKLGCANKDLWDLWGLCAPISIIVVYRVELLPVILLGLNNNCTVVCLSAESYTSYWGFLCNIQLPVILIVSIGKWIHWLV